MLCIKIAAMFLNIIFITGTDASESAVSLVVQAPPNTPSVSPLKQQLSHPGKSAAGSPPSLKPAFGRSTLSGPSVAAAAAAAADAAAVSKGAPPPIPPRGVQSTTASASASAAASQHVSTTYITQDEVVVTSSSPSGAKRGVPQVQISVTGANGGGGGGGDIRLMRDMLLTDNSVESS